VVPASSHAGEGGLATWTLDDIVNYLQDGVASGGRHIRTQNEVILNSMRHMTDEDIKPWRST